MPKIIHKELSYQVRGVLFNVYNTLGPNLPERFYRDATAVGVMGTPSIFVNGRLLRQRSMEGFRLIIEKELKKSGREDA